MNPVNNGLRCKVKQDSKVAPLLSSDLDRRVAQEKGTASQATKCVFFPPKSCQCHDNFYSCFSFHLFLFPSPLWVKRKKLELTITIQSSVTITEAFQLRTVADSMYPLQKLSMQHLPACLPSSCTPTYVLVVTCFYPFDKASCRVVENKSGSAKHILVEFFIPHHAKS